MMEAKAVADASAEKATASKEAKVIFEIHRRES
jgi:hypothetical protein